MNDGNVVDRLPIVILHPHSRCNCRCVMCDAWRDQAVKEIGLSNLERNAKDFRYLGVQWAVLSGGEPLMYSNLCGLSALLRDLNIRVTALSSGLLLETNASLAVRNFDDMIVSLDGPHEIHDHIRGVRGALDMLDSGIQAVRKLNPQFSIGARCTVQRGNCSELMETVKVAGELHLQSISFLAADVTSTAFNHREGWSARRRAIVALTEQETSALEAEIERMITQLPDMHGFVLETPEKLRRIVHHFQAYLGLVEPIAPRCNAPWVSVVIESDGTVRPCFFHPPIGNINEQRLAAIVNGPDAMEFRRMLDIPCDPICRRCVCSLFLAERT